MDFVAVTVNDERFLAADGVPRQGPVRESAPVWLLHHGHHFDWFDDTETEQVRRDDYMVAWRHRTRGVNDKPTRGFHSPSEHLVGDAFPNRVTIPNHRRHF
jgi:hypothetical protein